MGCWNYFDTAAEPPSFWEFRMGRNRQESWLCHQRHNHVVPGIHFSYFCLNFLFRIRWFRQRPGLSTGHKRVLLQIGGGVSPWALWTLTYYDLKCMMRGGAWLRRTAPPPSPQTLNIVSSNVPINPH